MVCLQHDAYYQCVFILGFLIFMIFMWFICWICIGCLFIPCRYNSWPSSEVIIVVHHAHYYNIFNIFKLVDCVIIFYDNIFLVMIVQTWVNNCWVDVICFGGHCSRIEILYFFMCVFWKHCSRMWACFSSVTLQVLKFTMLKPEPRKNNQTWLTIIDDIMVVVFFWGTCTWRASTPHLAREKKQK